MASTRLTYEGYQSIRRWGMVCPVDLVKSRNYIRKAYADGSGPEISAVMPPRIERSAFALYEGKGRILLNEWWIDAYEKGFLKDGDAVILAKVGHEVVHMAEDEYSGNDPKLAKTTGIGSDGTKDGSGYNHPAEMFEVDTYGKKAQFSLSQPYELIKDRLMPIPR